MRINRIAFIGLGMMGGSLAFLVKKYQPDSYIIGVDTDSNTLDFALSQGLIQEGFLTMEGLPLDLDLLWICTPIREIVPKLSQINIKFSSKAIVTDIGSIKKDILIGAKALNLQVCFIPGHPMAGIEKVGIVHANASIVEGAPYILIRQNRPEYEFFKQWLSTLNFNIIEMEADAHDRAMAYVSHLPYLMAGLTAQASQGLSKNQLDQLKQVLGPGFRDTTRVAASSPDWGTDVCLLNQHAVLEALDQVENALKILRQDIQSQDQQKVHSQLENFQKARARLLP